MPLVGFEPKISAGERPKSYALDRAATGTGSIVEFKTYFEINYINSVKIWVCGLGRVGVWCQTEDIPVW
jgi:hypothetical protein